MALTASAKKRIRQSATRAARNKGHTTRVRTSVKKVEEAIAAGDAKAAEVAFKAAMPVIHRGAQKGLMHKKNASRKLSRLSARIKKLKK